MSQRELLDLREQALLRGDLDTAEYCRTLIERGTVKAVLTDLVAFAVVAGAVALMLWALPALTGAR